MSKNTHNPRTLINEKHSAMFEKLIDALAPGMHVEFDPDEATCVGAFIEDALTEHDANESAFDERDFSHEASHNTPRVEGVNHE
ncbi:TPA: hypothetical protein NGG10_003184 [Legionella pneumophila]|nr:hypothetical protein [Legionella pneumophila]HCD9272332.1 hypothetical protein [Legionella pneumophila]HCD9277300.1 hypothetical protein [Legionella pneumophila]HCD9280456.1 hypothetical protein [Legionella pneumophila]HCD9288208.1 hypothetical protein [Legionella pneumophila]